MNVNKPDLTAMMARMRELESELQTANFVIEITEEDRDDYKSRLEQSGCTRHLAMETAIRLNRKYCDRIDEIEAEIVAKDARILELVEVMLREISEVIE